MATTRIKYFSQPDGTEKSRRLYSERYKTYYYVVKDMTGEFYTFRIVNANQQRTVYEHANSLITNKAVLHRTIRDKLKEIGVQLATEIRPHQQPPSHADRLRGGVNNSREAQARKRSRKVTDE